MRTAFGLAVAVAVAAAAGADDKPEKVDAKKLVGKWRVATPNLPKKIDAVMELTKDGKVIVEAEVDGKKKSVVGTYKLAGNKLTLSAVEDGKEDKETMTVTKLTDDELVTKDDQGKEDVFKRVKEKKGPDKK